MPAVLVDDLEKFLVEFGLTFELPGVEWHFGRLSENRAPLRCA
jgi:hypothetical protein